MLLFYKTCFQDDVEDCYCLGDLCNPRKKNETKSGANSLAVYSAIWVALFEMIKMF